MDYASQFKKHFQVHAQFYFVLAATFVFGLCAHGYRFLNLDLHHDTFYFSREAFVSWQISLGRPFHGLCWWALGHLGTPWVVGLISLFLLSLGNYFAIKIIKIKSSLLCALLCGVLTTNSVVTLIAATYLDVLDGFLLSYALAVFGVYLLTRGGRTCYFSIVAFGVSLSIYQCYINISIFLIMLLFLKEIMENGKSWDIFIHILKYCICLIGGGIFYLLIVLISSTIARVGLDTGIDGLAQIWNSQLYVTTPQSFLSLFFDTYKILVKYMLQPQTFHPVLAGAINGSIFIVSVSAFIFLLIKNKVKGLRLVLVLVCLALMPFGSNFAYFASGGHYTQLIYFPFFFLYAFAILLWEEAIPLINFEKIQYWGGVPN